VKSMSEVDCFAADVSKRELVIAIYPGGVGVKRIANQEAVINAWLDTLPAGSVIAMEATGIYHRRLADLAHTRGLVVYVVNPRDVYYDVRGMGARGKTDPSDAKLLARYVAHERMHLHPYLPPSALCERLVTLLEHRAVLVRTRQALTQSLAELPALGREKRNLFKAVAALLSGIDRELAALGCADPLTATLVTRLKTISGVEPLVASLLCALFKRFAFRHADALIAYLGLDPRPDESGQHSRPTPPVQARSPRVAPVADRSRHVRRAYPGLARLRQPAARQSPARHCSACHPRPQNAAHGLLLRTAFALFKNGQDFIPPSAQPT